MRCVLYVCCLTSALNLFFSSASQAQQNREPRRARVVSISFDGAPQKKRPLTREEKVQQSALIRHEKRLRSAENRAIPFRE